MFSKMIAIGSQFRFSINPQKLILTPSLLFIVKIHVTPGSHLGFPINAMLTKYDCIIHEDSKYVSQRIRQAVFKTETNHTTPDGHLVFPIHSNLTKHVCICREDSKYV